MSTFIQKHAKELNLKLVNAKGSLEVLVSPADVRQAKRKNSKCCAFARAVESQYSDVVKAYFLRSVAWLEFKTKMVRYVLPTSIQKEIVTFDRSGSMEPGLYQLSKPSPKKASKPKVRKTAKRTTPAKKRSHRTTKVRSQFEPNDV